MCSLIWLFLNSTLVYNLFLYWYNFSALNAIVYRSMPSKHLSNSHVYATINLIILIKVFQKPKINDLVVILPVLYKLHCPVYKTVKSIKNIIFSIEGRALPDNITLTFSGERTAMVTGKWNLALDHDYMALLKTQFNLHLGMNWQAVFTQNNVIFKFHIPHEYLSWL